MLNSEHGSAPTLSADKPADDQSNFTVAQAEGLAIAMPPIHRLEAVFGSETISGVSVFRIRSKTEAMRYIEMKHSWLIKQIGTEAMYRMVVDILFADPETKEE